MGISKPSASFNLSIEVKLPRHMLHGKHQVKAPSFKAMEEHFLKGLAHWFGYYIESDSTYFN
jgi:hypothetical protein